MGYQNGVAIINFTYGGKTHYGTVDRGGYFGQMASWDQAIAAAESQNGGPAAGTTPTVAFQNGQFKISEITQQGLQNSIQSAVTSFRASHPGATHVQGEYNPVTGQIDISYEQAGIPNTGLHNMVNAGNSLLGMEQAGAYLLTPAGQQFAVEENQISLFNQNMATAQGQAARGNMAGAVATLESNLMNAHALENEGLLSHGSYESMLHSLETQDRLGLFQNTIMPSDSTILRNISGHPYRPANIEGALGAWENASSFTNEKLNVLSTDISTSLGGLMSEHPNVGGHVHVSNPGYASEFGAGVVLGAIGMVDPFSYAQLPAEIVGAIENPGLALSYYLSPAQLPSTLGSLVGGTLVAGGLALRGGGGQLKIDTVEDVKIEGGEIKATDISEKVMPRGEISRFLSDTNDLAHEQTSLLRGNLIEQGGRFEVGQLNVEGDVFDLAQGNTLQVAGTTMDMSKALDISYENFPELNTEDYLSTRERGGMLANDIELGSRVKLPGKAFTLSDVGAASELNDLGVGFRGGTELPKGLDENLFLSGSGETFDFLSSAEGPVRPGDISLLDVTKAEEGYRGAAHEIPNVYKNTGLIEVAPEIHAPPVMSLEMEGGAGLSDLLGAGGVLLSIPKVSGASLLGNAKLGNLSAGSQKLSLSGLLLGSSVASGFQAGYGTASKTRFKLPSLQGLRPLTSTSVSDIVSTRSSVDMNTMLFTTDITIQKTGTTASPPPFYAPPSKRRPVFELPAFGIVSKGKVMKGKSSKRYFETKFELPDIAKSMTGHSFRNGNMGSSLWGRPARRSSTRRRKR
jgi:hypothetical protein